MRAFCWSKATSALITFSRQNVKDAVFLKKRLLSLIKFKKYLTNKKRYDTMTIIKSVDEEGIGNVALKRNGGWCKP
jgi:hypothetical protein